MRSTPGGIRSNRRRAATLPDKAVRKGDAATQGRKRMGRGRWDHLVAGVFTATSESEDDEESVELMCPSPALLTSEKTPKTSVHANDTTSTDGKLEQWGF